MGLGIRSVVVVVTLLQGIHCAFANYLPTQTNQSRIDIRELGMLQRFSEQRIEQTAADGCATDQAGL